MDKLSTGGVPEYREPLIFQREGLSDRLERRVQRIESARSFIAQATKVIEFSSREILPGEFR